MCSVVVAKIAAVNPRLLTISMPAFPPRSRRRQWIAYGSHIHALSGLGVAADGTFWAPTIAYPDPLAALAAFAVARRHVGSAGHIEVSLWSVVQGLIR